MAISHLYVYSLLTAILSHCEVMTYSKHQDSSRSIAYVHTFAIAHLAVEIYNFELVVTFQEE